MVDDWEFVENMEIEGNGQILNCGTGVKVHVIGLWWLTYLLCVEPNEQLFLSFFFYRRVRGISKVKHLLLMIDAIGNEWGIYSHIVIRFETSLYFWVLANLKKPISFLVIKLKYLLITIIRNQIMILAEHTFSNNFI